MKRSPAVMLILVLALLVFLVGCTLQRPTAREATLAPTTALVLATATGVVPTAPGAATPTATLVQQATTIATQPTATPTGTFDDLTGGETPTAEVTGGETPAVDATGTPAETPVATSEEATATPAAEAATPEAEVEAEVAIAPQGNANYTVRWGDTLFSIAQRFGTTVDEIKSANGLTSDLIYVGQELYVPGGGVPDGPGYPDGPDGPGPGVHIVQRGENLFRIALRYGTTVDAIARANHITNPWFIYVGQRLNIPDGGDHRDGSKPPDGPGRTHVVQPGETLYSIALRYNTEVHALVVANNLPNANYIYVGQVLNVP